MTEEQLTWQKYLPANSEERCPSCQTTPDVVFLWREADSEYQRQMDPTRYDGSPTRSVKDRKHALELARQRRGECAERHTDG